MVDARLERLRARLAALDLPGALILNPRNAGYLAGFSGSTSAMIVLRDRAVFVTDSRYAIQARRECPGFELAITKSSGGYTEKIVEQITSLGATLLAVEGDYLTIGQFEKYREKLKDVELKPVPDLAGTMRLIKDAAEISRIREACGIVDRAFDYLITLLRPGVTERHVAIELEYFLRREGSEGEAFGTTVASGAQSALPHARATTKPLAEGDLITFDYGARVGGYHSDITRTVVLGKASEKQREVYQVVLDAEAAGIAAIRAGADGKAVDQIARDLITSRGYGEHFGHGLGHGLGLSVHDHPALSPTSETKLEAGMVLTVEPGIYIEDWGGVRIEDDVLVGDDGCEVLTHAPRHLIEIPV